MSKKKMAAILLCIVGAVLINILIFTTAKIKTNTDNITFGMVVQSDMVDYYQIFSDSDLDFSEDQSVMIGAAADGKQTIAKEIQNAHDFIRIDFGSFAGTINVYDSYIGVNGYRQDIPLEVLTSPLLTNDIESLKIENNELHVVSNGDDSNLVIKIDTRNFLQEIAEKDRRKSLIMDSILCVFFDILILLLIQRIKIYVDLAREIFESRRLIATLSKNDFRTRFAGSYLGIVWAFIQPLVTVVVYWFVFQVGLRAGRMSDYPFVIFLITGLVPWFFFSDAWNGGTNALLEYNYLVKKVVFKISILPVVKVISNLFVHVFFILFSIVLCACYGYTPNLYLIQILYYMICTFALTLGLSYLTSAIVGFFRDLTQIINIILQVGMWMTPILWDASSTLSPALHFIFKLNPVYYIVNGYRDAFLGRAWFWNDMMWTAYFWIMTIAVLTFGTTIFRKLKVHFADVL